MLTDINLKDSNGVMEYTIECDLEKGLVHAWHVNLVKPMPLQTILNIPMMMRQASSAPCGQGQQVGSSQVTRKPIPAVTIPNSQIDPSNPVKVRISKDGSPIVLE